VARDLQHAPHLSFAAFVYHHHELRSLPTVAHDLHDRGGGQAVLQVDTLPQTSHLLGRRRSLNQDPILLLHAESRVQQAVGQFAVVGEQEQPGRIPVEPPYREYARTGRHAVYHRATPVRIVGGTDDTRGLVQQPVFTGFDRHRHTVYSEDLPFVVDTLPQLGHVAVDGHPSGFDEVLAPAARPHAGRGQHLLQSAFHGGSLLGDDEAEAALELVTLLLVQFEVGERR
jgi:hypothetical protein